MNQYLQLVKTFRNRTPVNILNLLKKFKHGRPVLYCVLTTSISTAGGKGSFFKFKNVIKAFQTTHDSIKIEFPSRPSKCRALETERLSLWELHEGTLWDSSLTEDPEG